MAHMTDDKARSSKPPKPVHPYKMLMLVRNSLGTTESCRRTDPHG